MITSFDVGLDPLKRLYIKEREEELASKNSGGLKVW